MPDPTMSMCRTAQSIVSATNPSILLFPVVLIELGEGLRQGPHTLIDPSIELENQWQLHEVHNDQGLQDRNANESRRLWKS